MVEQDPGKKDGDEDGRDKSVDAVSNDDDDDDDDDEDVNAGDDAGSTAKIAGGKLMSIAKPVIFGDGGTGSEDEDVAVAATMAAIDKSTDILLFADALGE